MQGRRRRGRGTATGTTSPNPAPANTATTAMQSTPPGALPVIPEPAQAAAPKSTRTRRDRRKPMRYRQSDPPIQSPQNSGSEHGGDELFDIHTGSESSSDHRQSSDEHISTGARVRPGPAFNTATNTAVDTTTTDALATGGGSNIPTSADIHYFFSKSKGESTTCNECRQVKYPCTVKEMANNATLRRVYVYKHTTSNSSLRPHIEKYHLSEYLVLAEREGWPIQIHSVQAALNVGYTFKTLAEALAQPGVTIRSLPPAPRPQSGDYLTSGIFPQPTPSLGADLPEFSMGAMHDAIVKFIVADDQSINVIECPEFRKLLLLLRRDLKDSDIPHRTKLRELILEAWCEYFKILKRDIANAVGQVSFTSDIWSADNLDPYIAMTAHWVARDDTGALKLKSALAAFHYIPGSHTGEELAKMLLHLLDRVSVTSNMGHFTLDNARNNDTAMKELSKLLCNEREIHFDPIDRRIMCFPHILNICVQHTIAEYTTADFTTVAQTWVDSLGNVIDKDAYVDAVRSNPIGLGRDIVRVIRASGSRRASFRDTILTGNEHDLFLGPDGESENLPVVELLRDVKTRWDSVYFMINRLRTLHQAIDYFLVAPRNAEIAKQKLSPLEWEVLQDLEVILEIPHMAQQCMSSESTPVLSGAVPAFEVFMAQWKSLSEAIPHCAPFTKVGLEWAETYYKRMGRTRAYAVAMFVDPSIRLSWVAKHWDPDDAKKTRETVIALMEEYRVKHPPTPSDPPAGPRTHRTQRAPTTLASKYGLPHMEVRRLQQGPQTVQEEYNAYTTSNLSHEGTDPLAFWDLERATFPTIFRIAMDYLPIQASSVPCERVFSSSSETDTKKRNRISPVLMEALQMLKFWLKKERLNFTKGWSTSQVEMLRIDTADGILSRLAAAIGDRNVDEAITTIAAEEGDGIADVVDIY